MHNETKDKIRKSFMSTTQMVDSIYISIASFLDDELLPTIESILNNTRNLENIFLFVLSQDSNHPDIDGLCNAYSFKNYKYMKVLPEQLAGVGEARSICQSKLSNNFKYFLQIDSHSRFKKDWDVFIINDYENIHDVYGKSIISTYPTGYIYNDDGIEEYIDNPKIPRVRVIKKDDFVKYEAKYCGYTPSVIHTGYFCAGQAFGRSEYFLEVPYDKIITFSGEEQTMSIRFFDKGTSIICPPRTYLYHDYVGTKRKRKWDVDDTWDQRNLASIQRVSDFYLGKLDSQYGVSIETIKKWEDCFVS